MTHPDPSPEPLDIEDPVGRLPEEWKAALTELGERPFRAQQLFRWLHQRAEFDPDKMSDLSVPFRARLRDAGVAAPFRVETVHESKDGTRKLVLVTDDGARVESVIIPMTDANDADAGAAPSDDEHDEVDEPLAAKSRVTLCISTQYGCAMGCVFCASGQAGLVRGLRASEIVSQVYLAKRYLRPDEQLSNLVYMGMGEPLHHYEQTARSLRLLTHPQGLGMSPRRITVSTVGLTPGIERLGRDFAGKIGLAVSVHAPNDETRDKIIPMNKRYPVAELMRALRAYPLPKRRRITIEYTLIDGVNDAPSHARELSSILRGIPSKINLIPMNPITASELRAPKSEAVRQFQDILANAGYSCFVRTRRGDEVAAACGQLAMADDLVRKKREREALRALAKKILMFKKVLVANRGEIACRIFRTCERLGIPTVAVFSDADVLSPHVAQADEAIRIGPAKVSESYLSIPATLAAIRDVGADCVHPGYGLLSERRAFADAVTESGATFIGPPSAALEAFGDKIKARQVARRVGVSPPPGSEQPVDPKDSAVLKAEAERIGLPLLIKAAAGGGGIGMQIVRELGELERAAQTCADRGLSAFGDGRIYLERYLEGPRHIEVQVFCDAHGHAVALGERECSVQRRHQKLIEESPSPAGFFSGPGGAERRSKLWHAALSVVRAVDYRGAGTVEFVADAAGELFFLEVNARLQVEHPVTELVTGLDLVELQLRVAAGEPLPPEALAARLEGHAIEVRLYAEDPGKGFLPQPGLLQRFELPSDQPGVRIDSGVIAGQEITPHYDPMLAKVAAHGKTREQALTRLQAALAACRIELVGPKGPRSTNLAFLQKLLDSAEFRAGQYDTGLAETVSRV